MVSYETYEIDKATVCAQIAGACKANGWEMEKNVKKEDWKADIVVEYSNYKIAFNVCKNPRNVEEMYKSMRKERVCGCWLLIPSVKSGFHFHKENLPYFCLTGATDLHVCLGRYDYGNPTKLTLSDFTESIVKGRIRWADKMKVRYVDVCFEEYTCWNCEAENDVYFISRMYSEDGVEKSAFDFHAEEDHITFNPFVVKAIQTYIATHPELGIRLGKIKQRFSKTRNESYMSFGCYKCDGLFGSYYINDARMDCMYDQDNLRKITIDLGDSGIEIPAMCWYKRRV